MLHVLHGPDRFRVREALDALRRELDTDGNLAISTTRLEAGTTPAELRAACQVASFFAENRLMIVDGLLGRLGGARRRGGRRRRADGAEAPSELDDFVDVLTNLPPTTTVVLLDEVAPRPLLDALGSGAAVRQFSTLRPAERRQWAAERARAQGAALSRAALDRLVALIDSTHLGELAQEIDKLATYANGREISVEDIDALVSGAIQHQIWDLTDAVIAGRADRALTVLRAMDDRDRPPQLLIFMLTRQYRQLMLVQALLGEGLSATQVGSRLGIGQPFPLSKVLDQAGRYPVVSLEAAYRRLLETDVAVKTGVLDAALALELLILDLAAIVRPPRAALARP